MLTAPATIPQAMPTASPHRAHRTRRGALRLAAAIAMLALAGTITQAVAARRDAAAHPPPGRMVTLADGRSLHVDVAGGHHDGPVVVLETGMGGFSPAWAWVQPAVAEHATVVAYDRAGLGWSDATEQPPTADRVVADLREALDLLGLGKRQYVLVGHSLGGHYVRAFAHAHPTEVAGMVLVDPSHERQVEVLGSQADTSSLPMRAMLRTMQAAARVGLLRLWDPFASPLAGLPDPARAQAEAAQATPSHWRTYRAEAAVMNEVAAQIAALDAKGLGDLPLTVLLAGHAPTEGARATVAAMVDLRSELADLSRHGRTRLLDDADHVSIVTDRTHAAVVTEAIVGVVAAAT